MKTAEELLNEANELIRSFSSVAEREGTSTNWKALQGQIKTMLEEQHLHIYGSQPGLVVEEKNPMQVAPLTEGLTDDPSDPDLGRGVDSEKTGQHKKYLVLSEEDRLKGFVRPYCDAYIHAGRKITGTLRSLTEEELSRYGKYDYVMFEEYENGGGMYISKSDYDLVRVVDGITYVGGCGKTTTMSRAIAETYAAKPTFYGSTYCTTCGKHKPVGEKGEFIWEKQRFGEEDRRVGS